MAGVKRLTVTQGRVDLSAELRRRDAAQHKAELARQRDRYEAKLAAARQMRDRFVAQTLAMHALCSALREMINRLLAFHLGYSSVIPSGPDSEWDGLRAEARALGVRSWEEYLPDVGPAGPDPDL